jgi:hypothetical protein
MNSSPPMRATTSSWRVVTRGVATLVAEGVVDPLQAVEVDEEQGERLSASPGLREVTVERLDRRPTVQQAGERVVRGALVQEVALLFVGAHRPVQLVEGYLERPPGAPWER